MFDSDVPTPVTIARVALFCFRTLLQARIESTQLFSSHQGIVKRSSSSQLLVHPPLQGAQSESEARRHSGSERRETRTYATVASFFDRV
jgi:hypothetical protein